MILFKIFLLLFIYLFIVFFFTMILNQDVVFYKSSEEE